MYAVVKTGGKQYRVEEGQTLLVERLPAEEGATVDLEPVLYRSDETVFDADGLKQVTVQARVVDHLRGPKLRVFKFKPKRGYRRRTGHRQELTRLEVTGIKLGAGRARGAAAKPAAERAAKPAAEKEAKPAAEKTAKPATERAAKPAAERAAKPAAERAAKPATKAAAPAKPRARKPAAPKTPKEDTGDGA
jgi:large subunit ribosomal protein L21